MVSETMSKAKAPPADVQARPPVMAAALLAHLWVGLLLVILVHSPSLSASLA